MGKLYKRGKVWWFQYRNQRISTRCTDKKAAEIFARRVERESADPLYAPQAPASLQECLNKFTEFQRFRGRAEDTITMNRKHAGHLVRLLGRDTDVNRISSTEVDGYVIDRSKEGASNSTIHKELSTLRGCLKLASRHGKYLRNLDHVMPQIEQGYVPRTAALTLEEVEELCAELTPQRAAHVCFIVATSARLGESHRALPEDVEPDRVLLRGTKTDKSWRVVPRLRIFAPLLKRAIPHLPFPTWHQITRDLAVACANAHLTRVTANDLRRSHATILRVAGVAPSAIAGMMGHADSRMVERVYGRIKPDELGAQINRATRTRTVRGKGEKA